MFKKLLVTGVVLGAIACTYGTVQQTKAAVQKCSERLVVIGSRGSGDSFSGNVSYTRYGDKVSGMSAPGGVFATAFANQLPKGQVTFVRNYYRAVGGIPAIAGAATKISVLGAYHDSVVEGKQILARIISDEISQCRATKMILVGYSQGAQVTGDVYQRLSAIQRQHVLGVILFGDPYFNSGDSAADMGNFLRSHNGSLGTRPLYPTGGHVLSYCHKYDPVCQNRVSDAIHGTSQHKNYDRLGEPQEAARYFVGLVQQATPVMVPISIKEEVQNWRGSATIGVNITVNGRSSKPALVPIDGRCHVVASVPQGAQVTVSEKLSERWQAVGSTTQSASISKKYCFGFSNNRLAGVWVTVQTVVSGADTSNGSQSFQFCGSWDENKEISVSNDNKAHLLGWIIEGLSYRVDVCGDLQGYTPDNDAYFFTLMDIGPNMLFIYRK